ncbi:MAG: Uma2 family endonuclease, partial [Fimbriiglobus sp.]
AFRDRPDVFVAGNHLIYPVEGDNLTRQAPDVYVAFGRPKGHRGSYRVGEEADVFPQVGIEVWSPNNRYEKMRKKFDFYERFGAEEYYILYPEFPAAVDAWHRTGDRLVELSEAEQYASPRLGIRFEVVRGQAVVYGPDGERLRTPSEIAAERNALRDRADMMAAKLRALGLDPDA